MEQLTDYGTSITAPPRLCEAEGCTAVLADLTKYCQARRLCPAHIKAPFLRRKGHGNGWMRFCFQCGKLESLEAFDGDRRSCRLQLARRRGRPAITSRCNSNSSSNGSSSFSQVTAFEPLGPAAGSFTSAALVAQAGWGTAPQLQAQLHSQLSEVDAMRQQLLHLQQSRQLLQMQISALQGNVGTAPQPQHPNPAPASYSQQQQGQAYTPSAVFGSFAAPPPAAMMAGQFAAAPDAVAVNSMVHHMAHAQPGFAAAATPATSQALYSLGPSAAQAALGPQGNFSGQFAQAAATSDRLVPHYELHSGGGSNSCLQMQKQQDDTMMMVRDEQDTDMTVADGGVYSGGLGDTIFSMPSIASASTTLTNLQGWSSSAQCIPQVHLQHMMGVAARSTPLPAALQGVPPAAAAAAALPVVAAPVAGAAQPAVPATATAQHCAFNNADAQPAGAAGGGGGPYAGGTGGVGNMAPVAATPSQFMGEFDLMMGGGIARLDSHDSLADYLEMALLEAGAEVLRAKST